MRFRKTVTLFTVAIGFVFALATWAQQKPFTQEQVSNMVRAGLGDETGARAIEQRGIDFAPAEDFLRILKATGASEAFLNAVRAAKHPEPADAKKPLSQVQVFALLAGGVPNQRITMLVEERGIDFEPTDDYIQEVHLAGGDDELITTLKGAKVTKLATVDPAGQARQVEIRHHMARGAEFKERGQYALAEQEYRAALLLDSQNADLYGSLAYILIQQRKWDDAATAAREAIHLNPNIYVAHNNLGFALGNKGDWDGAIMEYREALRLNPDNDVTHNNLGFALGNKGDWDGAIAEYREALRLNPNYDLAHANLGTALGNKGDMDGKITEEREAVRLNPDNALAHFHLGWALGQKGDWDGEITEEREAVRLNPNNALAHVSLGLGLEKKGDRQSALEEYRAAYTLDPKNAKFKQAYERLLQPSSQPAQMGAQRLQDVRRIYVSSFGTEDGAEVIRTKVITRLVKSGRFEVVQSADQADAILTGASQISKTESTLSNGKDITHYHATAGIQLINKNQNILWADDTSSAVFSRSASSSLADRIVNDLLKAISTEAKPK